MHPEVVCYQRFSGFQAIPLLVFELMEGSLRFRLSASTPARGFQFKVDMITGKNYYPHKVRHPLHRGNSASLLMS